MPGQAIIKKVDPNNPLKGLAINKNAHTIVLHCSASDNPEHDNPKTIKEWHLARNFDDIGYHFYIDQKGNLFKCRDMIDMPAAQLGYNMNTITICLGGLDQFTEVQFFCLELLCNALQKKYNGLINSKRLKVLGHRDVDVYPKDCPNFDYAYVLNLYQEGTEIITARWGDKKNPKSKDFIVPKYYLRPKEVTETRTGKGALIATGGTGLTATKAAIGTAAGVGSAVQATSTAQAVETVNTASNLVEISSVVNLASSIVSGASSLFTTLFSLLPWWLCIGIIFVGLAYVYYARSDDISKGDVKRIFKI